MVVGEFTVETELVVIGGGPGGYSAAFRAAELGVATTIIDDRERLGGSWLHAGCVRTKELLQAADIVRAAEHATEIGISFDAPRLDLARLRARLEEIVSASAESLHEQCDALGVTLVHGRASFDNSRQLSIANSPQVPRVRFRRAVIATGSRTARLESAASLNGSARVLNAGSAVAIPEIPRRLLVIGGSSTSIELASIYAAFGSQVTLIDRDARLMRHADADLIEPLSRSLARTLDMRLETTAQHFEERGDGIAVTFESAGTPSGEPELFDRVLVAIGRVANVQDLGLERTNVKLDEHGFIGVDEQMRTTDPRILAVGDVTGEPKLALKATRQGRIAGEVVAGWGSRFDVRSVPMVLFTDPQIAWCGLTEEEAAADGGPYHVVKSDWAPVGPSSRVCRDRGFTKIIYDPDTRLVLGIGIVGRGAAELIAEASLAVEMGAVTTDLAATLHPHPTGGEFMAAAARRVEEADPPPTAPAV